MKASVTTTKYYIANGCIDIPDTLADWKILEKR